MGARVGPVASGDEIGQLAGHLDHLLDGDRHPRAGRWNAELDAKVAERTRQLEAAGAPGAQREAGRGGPAHRQHRAR